MGGPAKKKICRDRLRDPSGSSSEDEFPAAALLPSWTESLGLVLGYLGSWRDVDALSCCGHAWRSACVQYRRRWPREPLICQRRDDLDGDVGGLRRLEDYCLTLEILVFERDTWHLAYTCVGETTSEAYVEFAGIPTSVGRRMARSWIAIGADNDCRVRVCATQCFGNWRQALLFDGHAHGFADGDQWRDGDIPLAPSANLPHFHTKGLLGVRHAVFPDIDIQQLISRRCRLRVDWRIGYFANCYDADVDTKPDDDLPCGPSTIYAHFAVPDPNHWLEFTDASPYVVADFLHAVDFR